MGSGLDACSKWKRSSPSCVSVLRLPATSDGHSDPRLARCRDGTRPFAAATDGRAEPFVGVACGDRRGVLAAELPDLDYLLPAGDEVLHALQGSSRPLARAFRRAKAAMAIEILACSTAIATRDTDEEYLLANRRAVPCRPARSPRSRGQA